MKFCQKLFGHSCPLKRTELFNIKNHKIRNAALYTMWKDDDFNISDAYCCKIFELP